MNKIAQILKTLILNADNTIFTVTFVKKNGEVRTMNCRLGVKKHLKGGGPSTTAHIPKYVTVYDMQIGDYRNINVETIQSVNINGLKITA